MTRIAVRITLLASALAAWGAVGAANDEAFAPKQDALPVAPPEGAIVLFGGADDNQFLSKVGGDVDWPITDGALVSTRGQSRSNHIVSKLHFRDADIHVEFQVDPKGSGNSGIYIHGNYELQIFDSFGKEQPTMQDEGAVYGFAPPLVNAARKAGEWQVYDIRYRAPRRDESGKIVEEGRITAWLNGQKVQQDTPVGEPRSTFHPFRYRTTPYLGKIWEQQKRTGVGPVFLQDHDSPTRFRNVWVRPLDDKSFIYTEAAGDADGAQLHTGQGILVGEVTATSALAQVRLTGADALVDRDVPGRPGVVEFSLTPAADGQAKKPRVLLVAAEEQHDFIARAAFDGLEPGVAYRCTTRIGADKQSLQDGPTATFKTLPGKDKSAAARFVVVTGMNYAKFHGDDRIDRELHKVNNNTELPAPYSGPDKHLGYPALATIAKLRPDFFVGTGDNVYYDTPTKPRAETIPQMRQKWHEQFVQPRYKDLFAVVPTYWEIDDHDYRVDDCDNTGDYSPSPADGRRMMLEQLPLAPRADEKAKTYRTHRVSRDLQIWLVEGRMYRSPNSMADGPKKTIWGAEQNAWLRRTLADS
ncbi:MAG: DUF1080 domain-containing protein, partial [Planctomycetales bacterium]|nr:DUF1080 domain-containing protein [Planctomycetales bacterium]